MNKPQNSYLLSDVAAKSDSPISIERHSFDIGIIAETLCRYGRLHNLPEVFSKQIGVTPDEAIAFISWVCAVHDIGKIHPVFQGCKLGQEEKLKTFGLLPEINRFEPVERFRHERYSAKIIYDYLLKHVDRYDAEDIAMVIACHHLGKGDIGDMLVYDNEYPIKLHPEVWQSLQEELLEKINSRWDISKIFELPDGLYFDGKCGLYYILAKIIVECDWISSSKEWFYRCQYSNGKSIETIAREFIEENALGCSDTLAENFSIDDFQKIFSFSPNKLQKTVMDISSEKFQLLIIECFCGAGKTEAGFVSALQQMKLWNKTGFIFCMPTMATTKAMLSRVRNTLSNMGYDLSIPEFDSKAFWSDNKEDVIDCSLWVSDGRQKMLYPSAVGTIDQVLVTITASKHAGLGLLGLSDKVIVIDEIHSYDFYMRNEITQLLKYCRLLSIPVIMMSATLATKIKEALITDVYDIRNVFLDREHSSVITRVYDGHVEETPIEVTGKQVHINLIKTDSLDDGLIKAASSFHEGCTMLVCPTVDKCIDIYKRINNGNKQIFHSRDTLEHKDERLATLLSLYGKAGKKQGLRPANSVCVATSIIEQSLDADFDNGVASLCPIDRLIQEIGRMFRHDDVGTVREGRDYPMIFNVVVPSNLRQIPIYDNRVLEVTTEVLEKYPYFDTAQDIRILVDSVYEQIIDVIPTEIRLQLMNCLIAENPFDNSIENCSKAMYNMLRQTNVKTRLESYPTVQIAIVSKTDLEGRSDFEIAKNIYTKKAITVAEKHIEGLDEYQTGNPFLQDIKIYISEDGSISSGEKTLSLTDLGLEIFRNYDD